MAVQQVRLQLPLQWCGFDPGWGTRSHMSCGVIKHKLSRTRDEGNQNDTLETLNTKANSNGEIEELKYMTYRKQIAKWQKCPLNVNRLDLPIKSESGRIGF